MLSKNVNNIFQTVIEKDFVNKIQKDVTIKMIDKFDCIKSKNFCLKKHILSKMKRQDISREKIFIIIKSARNEYEEYIKYPVKQ